MTFDFEKVWEDKREMRRKLAALPIAEKLRMLDAMRERALVLRGATIISVPKAKEPSPEPPPGSGS